MMTYHWGSKCITNSNVKKHAAFAGTDLRFMRSTDDNHVKNTKEGNKPQHGGSEADEESFPPAVSENDFSCELNAKNRWRRQWAFTRSCAYQCGWFRGIWEDLCLVLRKQQSEKIQMEPNGRRSSYQPWFDSWSHPSDSSWANMPLLFTIQLIRPEALAKWNATLIGVCNTCSGTSNNRGTQSQLGRAVAC